MQAQDSARVPSIAIAVINWNGARQTRQCLESLLALDYPSVRIAVVDNGSTDGSGEMLRREFPAVEVLRLETNRGFAAGCNAGIEWARTAGADFVWLLNNDTTVDPGTASALASAAMQAAGPLILAPKILFAGTDVIWSAGGKLRWPWLERGHVASERLSVDCTRGRSLAWASGCSLFFSIETADLAGPMDERYFLYLEDVEWCLRARRRGAGIRLAPDAVIWHEVSATTGSLDSRIQRYYANRNYYLLVFSHGGLAGRAWAASRIAVTLAKTAVRVAISPRRRQDGYYHAQTRAIADFLRGRFGKAPYSDDTVAPVTTTERQAVG